jgi:hypothetical protein
MSKGGRAKWAGLEVGNQRLRTAAIPNLPLRGGLRPPIVASPITVVGHRPTPSKLNTQIWNY